MRGFTLVRTIILARLLAPDDFGLMGIALLMLSLMERFTVTGLRPALIQMKGDIRPYLDTAWTIEVLRGILIGIILVLAAPFIAEFFDTPEAELIVKIMAAAMVARGCISVGIVYFQKDLEIQRRFKYEMAGVVADIGLSIGLAFVLHSVWALVYGTLAGSVALVVSSFMLHPYRPRLRLDWKKARELYTFGKWVWAFSALEFLRENLDQLLVGRILGTASLGFYQIAFRFSQLIGRELTQVARQVVFPTFSRLQDEREKLQRAYLETTQLVALLALPLAVGAFLLAPRLVPVAMGENWLPMVPALQVLSIVGLIRSLNASADVLFQGIGRPSVITKLDLATFLVLLALIYPLIMRWEITGAALAVLASTAVIYPFRVWISLRAIECGLRSYLRVMFVPLISSLLLVGALRMAEFALPDLHDLVQLVGLVIVGSIAYLSAVVLVDSISGRAVRQTISYRFTLR